MKVFLVLLSLFAFAVTGTLGFVLPQSPTQGIATATPLATPPRSSSVTPTALSVKKKNSKQEKEKIQVTDPLQLVLLYMTPWVNPNSIFVYLFAILYALGKYSEAKSMTGQ